MTVKESIYVFNKAIAYLADIPEAEPVIEAMQVAIEALEEKEKRQTPRRLTKEELDSMHGQPVWAEPVTGQGEWVTVHWNYSRCISTAYKNYFDEINYGKTWWAYSDKYEPEAEPIEEEESSLKKWARVLKEYLK